MRSVIRLIINTIFLNIFICALVYIQYLYLEPYKEYFKSIQRLEKLSALTLINTWICIVIWFTQDSDGSFTLSIFLLMTVFITNASFWISIFGGIFSSKTKRFSSKLATSLKNLGKIKCLKILNRIFSFSGKNILSFENHINHLEKENKQLKNLVNLMSKQIEKLNLDALDKQVKASP